MKFTIFGETQSLTDTYVVDVMIDALEEADIKVSKVTELSIGRNELTIIFKGHYYEPTNTPKDKEMVYYFNIKEHYVNNGGDDLKVDVDWTSLKEFYDDYAQAQEIMIHAIDTNNLIDAKTVNARRPDVLPSLSNSFYARWLIKTKNIKFLEWAKSVDKNIDFTSKSRFENPLKLAIKHNWEEGAIWLIDNYDIALIDKYDPLALIKQAKKHNLNELVKIMGKNEEIKSIIVKTNEYSLLPKEIQETFIF